MASCSGSAHRHGWAAPGYRAITVLALALVAYAASIELGGNGFIGAFIGGLVFGTTLLDREEAATLELDAQSGELLSLLVWFLFGAVMVAALDATTWATVVLRVPLLSLTVARMLAVAIAAGRDAPARADGRVHRLVRSPGVGVGRVRHHRVRFADRPRRRRRARDHHPHGRAQRRPTWRQRGPLSRRYGEYMAAVRGARPELATVPALASRPRSGVRRLSP